MFGKKKVVNSPMDKLMAKLEAIEEFLEDIQDDIKKVSDRITKVEDKLGDSSEIQGLKGELRQKSKFVEELLMKLIAERPHVEVVQPSYNRYNGYKSNNPNVAGPQGKLPG